MHIQHLINGLCTRVDGHTYPTPTHLNYTLFHPVGVCALVSPLNVPFMTATGKVAPCLAFGNTAVLKMSELSPLSAAHLGELALEAGIPAGVLDIVHGTGQATGAPLCSHREVRAISFTGSTATGQRIGQAAGLKKFSREFGGKSPFVIFADADADADLGRALDAALFMIFPTTLSAAPPAAASWCSAPSMPTLRSSLPRVRAASAWLTRWTRPPSSAR